MFNICNEIRNALQKKIDFKLTVTEYLPFQICYMYFYVLDVFRITISFQT